MSYCMARNAHRSVVNAKAVLAKFFPLLPALPIDNLGNLSVAFLVNRQLFWCESHSLIENLSMRIPGLRESFL